MLTLLQGRQANNGEYIKIGVIRTPKPPDRLSQNPAWLIIRYQVFLVFRD